jgi:hypothetical protein
VRAALESNSAEITQWHVLPIIQGRASAAGVYRVAGTAQDGDTQRPWSLVVKAASATALHPHAGNNASNDPTHMWYWKRELLLYQSGFFESLPVGLAAPRCYQIDEEVDEGRIWMEDICEDLGAMWPLEHYGEVARHFGRLNGLYAAKRTIPQWPWLLVNSNARRALGSNWPDFAQNYAAMRHESPLVQRGWTDELFDGYQRIWQDRERFAQALGLLPKTLQHNDAGRKNLFARQTSSGTMETVAVDWGLFGIGAVGEELATVVGQPVVWFNGVQPQQLNQLDQIAFEGYVNGLGDVGWQGDPTLVRLGYTLTVVLRLGLGIFIPEWTAKDEKTRIFVENAMGHSFAEISDMMRGFRGFVVACAEEARQLMNYLPSQPSE